MAIRCYSAPPDPSYYDSGYVPEYGAHAPEYSTPYEYEPCMRDYPDYLRQTYLVQSTVELEAQLHQKSRLENPPPAPKAARAILQLPLPWRLRVPALRAKEAREIRDREYPPGNYTLPEEGYIVRPTGARIAQELEDFCFLAARHRSVEIDDIIQQIGNAYRTLRRLNRKRQSKDGPPESGRLPLA